MQCFRYRGLLSLSPLMLLRLKTVCLLLLIQMVVFIQSPDLFVPNVINSVTLLLNVSNFMAIPLAKETTSLLVLRLDILQHLALHQEDKTTINNRDHRLRITSYLSNNNTTILMLLRMFSLRKQYKLRVKWIEDGYNLLFISYRFL